MVNMVNIIPDKHKIVKHLSACVFIRVQQFVIIPNFPAGDQ